MQRRVASSATENLSEVGTRQTQPGKRGRSKVQTATSFVNLHGASYCQGPQGQLSIPGGWRLYVV